MIWQNTQLIVLIFEKTYQKNVINKKASIKKMILAFLWVYMSIYVVRLSYFVLKKYCNH